MAHLINVTALKEEPEMDTDEPENAQFSVISGSRALVSPNDKGIVWLVNTYLQKMPIFWYLCNLSEYDLIIKKITGLMEEGRGECIFEVGLGSEPPGSNESCDAEDSEQASGK